MEERELLSTSWPEFAFNAQHTADSPVAGQDLQAIRWQTPVDLNPQYSGNSLLIHYGSPVITPSNTVIIPVKTGATDGFEVEAVNGTTGSVLWTQSTDYTLPPHNWTPEYSPVLTPQNRLYFAGAGGTIYYLDNPDAPGSHTATRLVFYTSLLNYLANRSAYNSTVFIDTPLTADSQGDIFFGFRVTGSNPSSLVSGIARIAANGTGIWVSAASAAGDSNIAMAPHNMAPALSNDQSTLYVGVRSASTSYYGRLLGLDSTTLATKYNSGVLKDPRNNGNNAGLLDDSTASPMVGPDGDVYYGVFGNPYNGSRGFMLRFSGDLATEKTPGAFGWDDTASIVPAAAVPSYTGTSSYLIFTKYNNYVAAEVGSSGGDGVNKIAILDPNATQVDTRNDGVSNFLVMKEILTIAGPTPDTAFINQGYPNAVREWCINSAVVDPTTHSVFANSEDGKVYRWNLDTNTLSQFVTLTPGIGEAYTTTLIGPDGVVYATNNATLFAVDAANHFSISAPASATAGSAFSITVTALDVNNQTAVGYTGTIHFSSSDMGLGVSLPANYTFTAADAGVHTFTGGVTLVTAGNQTVTATDAAHASITGPSNNILVNAAAATHFSVMAPPTATAGSAFTFSVTALDQFNNTATGYGGTVHFTSTDGGAILPANSTLTNGTGSFSATLVTAGNQTITATDTANASITGTSNAILVGAAAATHFSVSAPASSTAGAAFTFTVTALDPFNNKATSYGGTVHFTSTDGGAILPADSTLSNGTGSLSATLVTAGSQTITATDTANASITGTSNTILVSAAAATHFGVSAPASVVTGSPFTFTVTALDPFNNTATSYSGVVQFTSSDSRGGLPGNSTLTNGTGSFGATLRAIGNQTITATDTVNSSITGTSNPILVSAAAATHFSVSAPASATAGSAFNFTVTALDQFNNTATGYGGTVHFTSSDAAASLPANSTLSNGAGSFSATLVTAGSQTITATDTANASITGTSNTILVSAAAATHFAVSAPSSATAGTAFSFTVTALDPFNNTATGYSGTVHFTSSDGGAILPANSTLSNGSGSFSATLVTAGSQTITATDTASASITGTSNTILVSAAAATHFSVSAPASATAGSAFNFTVTALDQFNNTATGYGGTVHFTSSDAAASLPANSTLSNGAGSFSATLVTAGSQTITATDTANASITGTSNTILVSAAAATHFAVSAPSSATAGTAFSFTVTALDQFNNTATGYGGTVHFTSSDAAASLPANSTLSNGAGSFSATLVTAGSQTITATDTANASITGTSNTILVSAAAAASFVVAGYPSPVTAGTTNSFTVTAKDPFGNRAMVYAGTIHFTSSDPKAVLPANYTFTGGDAGMHMFSATLRTAGSSQSITGTDTVSASITGSQSGITVYAAATTHLVVSRFPSKTTAGTPQSFRVTAQDMFGNTTPAFMDTVAFSSSDSNALLPMPYTFTSMDMGAHNFTATLVTVGSQSITARDSTNGAVASGTQSGIVVNPAAASHLQVAGFPSSVIAGTAHNFTVTALDPYGNIATGYQGTVKFTSSDMLATLPANYTFTSGDAGVHMFSATLNTTGTNQSITATDTVTAGIMGTEGGISVVTVQPTASIGPTPKIGVPGQPLTFTFNASESGPFAGPPYTYSVDWGDQSPMQSFQSSTSSAIVMAPHTFTMPGSFTITVTAKDPSGNASMPATRSVSITPVTMEPDPTDPNNSSLTALYVGGTLGDDNIAITPAPGGGVRVGMNYVNYGNFYPTGHVVIYSQSGNDIIKTAAQTLNVAGMQAVNLTYVTVPLLVFAGNGNDILNVSGSSVGNVLVGGGGLDRLIGGQGRDILIGGAGLATLQAGDPPATNLTQGGAILIGGTTDYDADAKALASLLAEWGSANDYATRMAHLNGMMSGGLNGGYLLKFSYPKPQSTDTVHDNHLADKLYGGAGMDWYFYGIMDVYFNKTADETATPIS